MIGRRRTKLRKSKKSLPRAVDLFSGCGGLSLGLKQAGFKLLAAIELDATASEAYRVNNPDVVIKQADIRAIVASKFMRELKLRRGELELLAGCPPCQGFSNLRTRNGTNSNRDQRNQLVSEMLRFARAFLPKSIMMENVPGLSDKRVFRELCGGLEKLGYRVTWAIKNVADFGVPQRRKRLILLAGRKFKISFAPASRRVRTVRDAIGSLPRPGRSRDRLHNIPEYRSKKIQRLIRDIPKDGGSREELGATRQLKCHRRSDGFKDVYGRMAWDDVSPTITSGCFNPSKGRFLHPRQNRAITLREAALLQTFPRSYRFPVDVPKEELALLIGNALPPEFIRRQALKVLAHLSSRRAG